MPESFTTLKGKIRNADIHCVQGVFTKQGRLLRLLYLAGIFALMPQGDHFTILFTVLPFSSDKSFKDCLVFGEIISVSSFLSQIVNFITLFLLLFKLVCMYTNISFIILSKQQQNRQCRGVCRDCLNRKARSSITEGRQHQDIQQVVVGGRTFFCFASVKRLKAEAV